MLGLPAPIRLGHFAIVRIGNGTTLDFMDSQGDITQQHYAFLVSESELDEIFGRVRERGLPYWADPFRREQGRINNWDSGCGVYLDDPGGHLLEAITRSYGPAGPRQIDRIRWSPATGESGVSSLRRRAPRPASLNGHGGRAKKSPSSPKTRTVAPTVSV